MDELSTFYVSEPPLIFSQGYTCSEPQGGLYLHGPYGKYLNGAPNAILADTGIIGSSNSITDTRLFFDHIKKRIPTESKGRLDFPGIGLDGKLMFDLQFDEQWIEEITSAEIEEGKDLEDREERIHFFLNIIEKKIATLHRKNGPIFVLLPIPIEILNSCKKPGQIGYHITITDRRFSKTPTYIQEKREYDFHNIIKLIGMKYELPTQLILPNTLELGKTKFVQDLATRAWNLTVALYYKSRGVPWKIAKLDPHTCYAGVSFARELSEEGKPLMKASIAHLFLASGECFVLTGESIESTGTSEPKLTEEQAENIRNVIISGYEDAHGVKPKRIVIYKKTDFNKNEINGFIKKDKNIKQVDLITTKASSINWYRQGEYPPPRGTVIRCPGEYQIFTLGFIQEMETYPNTGIPIPLRTIPYNLDSNEEKMCREILSLSKLNWNNINYSELFPAPISVSNTIGQILSEGRARGIQISKLYKYYM
ncbi:MAG: hypothetical protein Q8O01_00140 [Candidatus Omnitrophota bacterium]|nr:hypothetical protein [Candidatus Omnitrophota bacterium]